MNQPKTSRPVKELIKEIELHKALTRVDLSRMQSPQAPAGHNRALPGFQIRLRQSQEALASLLEEYGQRIVKGLGGIFLFGPQDGVEAFRKIAEGTGAAVDTSVIYRQLAKDVDVTMRKDREFGPSQFSHLSSYLARLCSDAGISTPRISFKAFKILPSFDDLVEHIRDLVRAAPNGEKMNFDFMARSIVEQASTLSHEGSTFPVLVTGSNPDEMATLKPFFGGRVVRVNINSSDEVSVDFVGKAFGELKKQFSQKKQK